MIDLERAEMGYSDGFDVGYTWLTSGLNFIHPSETKRFDGGYVLKGYIPGGPYVFTASNRDEQKYQALARVSRKYHDDWLCGWVDGINTYVRENNLSYPEVAHAR